MKEDSNTFHMTPITLIFINRIVILQCQSPYKSDSPRITHSAKTKYGVETGLPQPSGISQQAQSSPANQVVIVRQLQVRN